MKKLIILLCIPCLLACFSTEKVNPDAQNIDIIVYKLNPNYLNSTICGLDSLQILHLAKAGLYLAWIKNNEYDLVKVPLNSIICDSLKILKYDDKITYHYEQGQFFQDNAISIFNATPYEVLELKKGVSIYFYLSAYPVDTLLSNRYKYNLFCIKGRDSIPVNLTLTVSKDSLYPNLSY